MALSFVVLVLLGWAALSLPVAQEGAPHHWVDDLFMAASAVCVTGLVPIDPSTSYSGFGEVVLLLLFQLGGLGYMILFTVGMALVGRRVSLRDRLNVQRATDQPGMTGLIRFGFKVIRLTLIVEAIGFLLLTVYLVPEHGPLRGAYLALFHAVSAFNNAGFSLFPDGAMRWSQQGGVLLVLGSLVVIGGLGYTVMHELSERLLFRRRGDRRWDVLLQLVVLMTGGLLGGGAILLWLIERGNPDTFGAMPWYLQGINAFFMATQTRSGFASVEVAAMQEPSLFVLMGLMFIGGAPGGTAGGIKLTTLAIVAALVMATLRGQDDVNLPGLKVRIGWGAVRKAVVVTVLSAAMIALLTFVLNVLEPLPFLPVLFEVVSAFSVVGLSMGITGDLSHASKLVLVGAMLIGRVGILTWMMAFLPERPKSAVHYGEATLLVG